MSYIETVGPLYLGTFAWDWQWTFNTKRKRWKGAKIVYKTKHVLIASVTNKAGFHFPLSYPFFLKSFKFSNSKGIWLKISLTWSWPQGRQLAEELYKIHDQLLHSEDMREKEARHLLGMFRPEKLQCNKRAPQHPCLIPKINLSRSASAAIPKQCSPCCSLQPQMLQTVSFEVTHQHTLF